jgi:hypothetical protein
MDQNTIHCYKCNCDVPSQDYSGHNCYYQKKIKELEVLISKINDENEGLKSQNEEIRVLIEEMEKETVTSFDDLMSNIAPLKEKLGIK